MASGKSDTTGSRAVVCSTEDRSCDALDEQLARSWLRIAIAGVFAGQGMVFSLAMNMTPPPYDSTAYWVLHSGLAFSAVVVMLFLGGPLFRSTFGMLRSRKLSIEGLFTLSLMGAFVGSLASSLAGEGGVYYEVVSIVIAIYTFGRMLSERSQARLALESEKLREQYDEALRVDSAGQAQAVQVTELSPGDIVRVDPGAPFTIDGKLLSGLGYVRETALTGEPLPVVRRVGDRVRAGTWSVDGAFEVEVLAAGGDRELDRILQTVETLSGEPSELQLQANHLIQWFLPLVAGVSLLSAAYWAWADSWVAAVFNSMAVLLVACPCALGLATPVAIWQGLYRLAQMGLVSRNGSLVDALANTKHLFFDKTGTLSESEMRVTEQLVADSFMGRRAELLAAVRAVQDRVTHPIAQALVRSIPEGDGVVAVDDLKLLPGQGVRATVRLQGRSCDLRIGEAALVDVNFEANLNALMDQLVETEGKRTCVFVDGEPVAIFVLRERAREGVDSLWDSLRDLGIEASVLTGDPEPQFQLPEFVALHTGLSASDKSARVSESKDSGETPVFIGDGVNDTAAMAYANASVAMGTGAGFARSAATGQLTSDQVGVLPEAVTLCRSITKRLRGNLIYAACYNVVGMALAAVGWLHPVAAAVIMLVSSFMVTARALKFKQS
ncbi:MAG: heavy metal translocating P-type ATPase [Opitutaceae bacterium]